MEYLQLTIKSLPEIETVCGFSCEQGYSTGDRVASIDSVELTLVSEGTWNVTMLNNRYDVKQGQMKAYPPMIKRSAVAVGKGCHTHNSIYMRYPAECTVLSEEQFIKQAMIYRERHAFETMGYQLFLPIITDMSEHCIQKFNAVLRIQEQGLFYAKLKAAALLLQMLIEISEGLIERAVNLQEDQPGSSSIVQRMIAYINMNYKSISSIEEIAANLNYNPSYLSTAFRKSIGTNPIDYINRLRVEKAKVMIEEDELSFTEIAEQVGVKNAFYFFRIFKKYTKMTMGQYANMFYR